MKIFSDNIPVTSATPAFDNEEIEFRIEEADARKISLVAVSRETGKAMQIGNAVVDDLLSTKSTDIWVFFWNGENVPDGTYSMSAHVLRNDGTTIDTLPVSIVIQHAKDSTPPAVTNVDASRDDTTVATSLSVSLPEKEDILLRVNEPSACTNALECATFCESEADEVCVSYAQYDAYPNDEGARSLAEGVSPERVFLMLSEPRRRPQELPEIVTTVEEFIAYCAELANEEVCTKALARNELATAESHEERKAALRRESEEQERIWGERVGARGFTDSDHDGITDYDEINMYHTDPDDEDTDQDGFIDGEELLARTNPNGNADNDTRLKAEDGSRSPDEEIRLENPLIWEIRKHGFEVKTRLLDVARWQAKFDSYEKQIQAKVTGVVDIPYLSHEGIVNEHIQVIKNLIEIAPDEWMTELLQSHHRTGLLHRLLSDTHQLFPHWSAEAEELRSTMGRLSADSVDRIETKEQLILALDKFFNLLKTQQVRLKTHIFEF